MVKPENFLQNLPDGLRDELVESYSEIVRNYSERRWEPSELNGGKFCEVVYSVVDGAISGNFPAQATKPNNMVDACRLLESSSPNPSRTGDRSLRILIPRMVLPLYEIRNNRGVGHVGGDVNPNYMDATTVLAMASWILAELCRIFHNVSIDEAQETVDALVEKRYPLVWGVGNVKRVLDSSMSKTDQTLLLLHSTTGWVDESKLCEWVEHSNSSVYRRDVLKKLHSKRLLEYNQIDNRVHLSPNGVRYVEEKLLQ
ncbi:hypothetical protein H6783_01515 [Candidatus Nomurabacteria bacterium]|nr:hypothetical protein [Candidatus Nomurabacteria bacterium]